MVLFIYGAGGAGNEVYDMVIRNDYFDHKYYAAYYVDDYLLEGENNGTRVIRFDNCKQYFDEEGGEFVISVGEPSVRKKLAEKVRKAGFTLATLVDRTAIVSHTAKIGQGCLVYANATISSDVVIKDNCLIMFQSIIGHHASVEEHCVICPKATVGGHSSVGEQTFLGLGSSMIQGATIGKKVIVALGAMIFRSVPDSVTVVGNPARITKGSESHTVLVHKE